jgi:hypothetical protein
VFRGSGLGDVAVVVTRYFGEIKLGTGGLSSSGAQDRPFSLALLAEGTPLLNRLLPGDLPRPADTVLPIEGNQLLVQIPACF